jgi:hypothetical protein
MRTKLTPEEKAARDLQKKMERKEKAAAERRAKIEAQAAAWKAEHEKRKLDFQQSLTDEARESLKLLRPDTEKPDYKGELTPAWSDAFIGDLAKQYEARGYLSPMQLDVLVKRLRREKETQALVAKWPEVKEGEIVKLLATVKSIEKVNGEWGPSWKVKLTAKYGRPFSFKTNNEKFLERARRFLESQDLVIVNGKVKWVSQDGKYAALTSQGLKFGGFLETSG